MGRPILFLRPIGLTGMSFAAHELRASAPPTPSFCTNFDDNLQPANTTTGNFHSATAVGGTVAFANQRMEVTPLSTPPTTHNGLITSGFDDARGRRTFAKFASSGAIPVGQEFWLVIGIDNSNTYLVFYDNGNLNFFKQVAGSYTSYGTAIAYNSTTHAWIGIRHEPSTDTLYFETAPSSASNPPIESDWTVQISHARDGIALDQVKQAAGAGTYQTVTPVTIYVDGFNTATAAAAVTSYTLTADAGTFSYTGQAANLLLGYDFVAAQGTYTYTGQAVVLNVTLTANAGTYSYSGQAANLTLGYDFAAAFGTFTYTGQNATLTYGYDLAANFGTYSYSGQPANLTAAYAMAAAQGAFTYNGQDAVLGISYPSATGIFTYSGQPANLVAGHGMLADPGAFTYTGEDAGLRAIRSLAAAFGTYAYTGQNARADLNLASFPPSSTSSGARVTAFFRR